MAISSSTLSQRLMTLKEQYALDATELETLSLSVSTAMATVLQNTSQGWREQMNGLRKSLAIIPSESAIEQLSFEILGPPPGTKGIRVAKAYNGATMVVLTL